MKAVVVSNEVGTIIGINILPEDKNDHILLQKIKRDADKHIKVVLNDQGKLAEWVNVEITIGITPAYL